MQSGRISDESAKNANLLKTQIATPEMFTAHEASLIAKNQRLPNGMSLNSSGSWAEAPWSKPGTVHHDWKLIKARYSDQPEVLAAFEKWAAKTEIVKGFTVNDWITNGVADVPDTPRPAPIKAPKSQAEKTEGAAIKPPQLKGLESMENDHSLRVPGNPGKVQVVGKPAESIPTPGRQAPGVKPEALKPKKPAEKIAGVKPYMSQTEIEDLAIAQVNKMPLDRMKAEALAHAEKLKLPQTMRDTISRSKGKGEARSRAIQARMVAIRAESEALQMEVAKRRGTVHTPDNDDSDLATIQRQPKDGPPGESKFAQPARNKSRYGVDVDFALGEESALSAAMNTAGRKTIGQVPDLAAEAAAKVASFEAEVAAAKVEHAAVWTSKGEALGRFTSNLANEVDVPPQLIPGNITSHNHPNATPPSMRDVNLTVAKAPLEVRVVTPEAVHRLRPGLRAHLAELGGKVDVESVPGFDRQMNALDIIATRQGKQNGWSRDMETDMIQQGMLEWLADKGIIHYDRVPR